MLEHGLFGAVKLVPAVLTM